MMSEASARPDQKTILVVEDSDEIRELLGFVLEAEGYQVVALEDGRDVVETAREQQPVLITLDLALPGKDGWAIVRELQDDEKTRDIPILVISATPARWTPRSGAPGGPGSSPSRSTSPRSSRKSGDPDQRPRPS